ncbi:hypothetical protein FE257_003843 [Aspergillus nanangensis]|uniref:Uncharacterized protein n=1 Tax=Aspergillus nanangensis TaxID=2582783 RepID=A0AAD4CB59_ASPNN|nr:hypothetical protein FE257_003843 [Aspergillus nanangensis]
MSQFLQYLDNQMYLWQDLAAGYNRSKNRGRDDRVNRPPNPPNRPDQFGRDRNAPYGPNAYGPPGYDSSSRTVTPDHMAIPTPCRKRRINPTDRYGPDPNRFNDQDGFSEYDEAYAYNAMMTLRFVATCHRCDQGFASRNKLHQHLLTCTASPSPAPPADYMDAPVTINSDHSLDVVGQPLRSWRYVTAKAGIDGVADLKDRCLDTGCCWSVI